MRKESAKVSNTKIFQETTIQWIKLLYLTFISAVLSHLGDQANARKAYEKAIQLDAENPQIFYNYAIFEMKQKNVENAIKLAKMCETALASSHPHYKVCKFSVQNVKTVHWCSKQNILCNLKIA